MEIRPLQTVLSGNTGRKDRLRHLLAYWRKPPFWHTPDGDSYRSAGPRAHVAPALLARWREILRTCEVIPPRSLESGLRRHLHFAGVPEANLGDTLTQDRALILGPRAAVRTTRQDRTLALGYGWALILGEADRDIAEALFREITEHDGQLSCSTPTTVGQAETLALLVLLATELGDTRRCWELACGLNVDARFTDALPRHLRSQLADQLVDLIGEYSAWLAVSTDIALDGFAEGGTGRELVVTARSRIGQILMMETQLGYLRRPIQAEYFDSVMHGLVRAGSAQHIGNALAAMPLGRTMLVGLDYLREARPELLGDLMSHPGWYREALCALLGLEPVDHWGPYIQVVHAPEWNAVQQLARWFPLDHEGDEAIASLVDLHEYDLEREIAGMRSEYAPERPLVGRECWGAIQKALVEEPAGASALVDELASRLNTERPTPALLLAGLRALGVLWAKSAAEALRLGRCLVNRYVLTLNVPPFSTFATEAWADFGADLHALLPLRDADPACWSRWTAALDLDRCFGMMRGPADEDGNPFNVSQSIEVHAWNLTALAASLDRSHTASREDAITQAVEIYEASGAAALGYRRPFNWPFLARPSAASIPKSVPLFVLVGRVLGDLPQGDTLARKLLRASPSPVMAGHLLLGLAKAPVAAEVQPHFLELTRDRLKDDKYGVSLGEAQELAVIAERAKLFDLSLHCVAVARNAIARLPLASAGRWATGVTTIRLAVLVEQERWEDVLQEDVPANPFEAGNALNLRALALQKTGAHKESLVVLDEVLRASPSNEMALVNRVSAFLDLKLYSEALEGVTLAETRLGGVSTPLQINKAVALAGLGQGQAATSVAQALPADERYTSEILSLRRQLGMDGDDDSAASQLSTTAQYSPRKGQAIEPQAQQYDVALSFAGEDREYVEQVAQLLERRGIKVFYDMFEEARLWGEDLYVYLTEVYRNSARYCVMFLSKHYAAKAWTNLERKAAQTRAFETNSAYILPARFDGTEIPGIIPTTGYTDLKKKSPEDLCDLIVQKLRLRGDQPNRSIGRRSSEASGTHESDGRLVMPIGYVSPYFANTADESACIMENAQVLVCAGTLSQAEGLVPIMENAVRQEYPLLVFADDIEGHALSTMIVNVQRRVLASCAVALGTGSDAHEVRRRVAKWTGATIVGDEAGVHIEMVSGAHLGRSPRVEVDLQRASIASPAAV